MSKIKRCKLSSKRVFGPPGTVFNCYGHQWIIQANGDAIGMIHQDFHATEVPAGRYVVLEDEKKPEDAYELTDFTMDIGTYYGAGDMEKLQKKISKLRSDALMGFAVTRFAVQLPNTMTKRAMTAEIMNLVAQKSVDVMEKKSDPVTQEPKKKRGRPPIAKTDTNLNLESGLNSKSD
jgi:hypothetical protein